MNEKLTPWFSRNQNPRRHGIYEVNPNDDIRLHWSYFDGQWNGCWETIASAFSQRDWGAGIEVICWRGLATPPKGE